MTVQDDPISGEDLLCYSFQVARGMEFLASKQVRRKAHSSERGTAMGGGGGGEGVTLTQVHALPACVHPLLKPLLSRRRVSTHL